MHHFDRKTCHICWIGVNDRVCDDQGCTAVNRPKKDWIIGAQMETKQAVCAELQYDLSLGFIDFIDTALQIYFSTSSHTSWYVHKSSFDTQNLLY